VELGTWEWLCYLHQPTMALWYVQNSIISQCEKVSHYHVLGIDFGNGTTYKHCDCQTQKTKEHTLACCDDHNFLKASWQVF
jgi:hypothetical protein